MITAASAQNANRAKFRIFCFAFLLILCQVASKALACGPVYIDQVWSGTSVGFGGAVVDSDAYAGYYDKDRKLTVANINLTDCQVKGKISVNSVFSGWDSHKEIVAAIDQSGGLHVVGNMHNSPLEYFYAPHPRRINKIKRASMTGVKERSVTYPRFIKLADRNLLFLYRDGGSGNGEWYANKLKIGRNWEKVSTGPLFSRVDRGGRSVSAYLSNVELSSDGYYHVAIVWRRNSDVASNFLLSYAKTRNFSDWYKSDGSVIATPITPDDSETVANVGQGKGLINNQKIAFDAAKGPVIAYTKYTTNNRNGVFVAALRGGRWQSLELAVSRNAIKIEGGGSIPNVPRISNFLLETRPPSLKVKFFGEEGITVLLPELHTQQTEDKRSVSSNLPFIGGVNLASRNVNFAMLPATSGQKSEYQLIWAAQAANRDVPRQCSNLSPKACDPDPTPLWLVSTTK
ncbi:BNR repeat-containing protein [Rhizobium sp. TRM95796]|uniref:BNR repeat-containing protein n=1 Tax=Rhizobium sp. TRM95796 TaxID=2979862 RepID=UPI0021E7A953|nr:BNR repeat-containing protein [Rhizobium sp. TRM95796]MCV3769074.1 BNR repeat-containing protein [Rhizobium sp. TRM95796]